MGTMATKTSAMMDFCLGLQGLQVARRHLSLLANDELPKRFGM